MTVTVRERLEQAQLLVDPHARTLLVGDALKLLESVEADARRWAAFCSAAENGDDEFLDDFEALLPDASPAKGLLDLAMDRVIEDHQ